MPPPLGSSLRPPSSGVHDVSRSSLARSDPPLRRPRRGCSRYLEAHSVFALSGRFANPDSAGHRQRALGRDSFQGGYPTALLGLGFHFFIAFSVFATYYFVSRRVPLLVRHALILGPLYGIAVYFFMQFVVFPLSAIGSVKHPLPALVDGILTHIFCVGLPVGLVTYEAARRDALGVPR